MPVPGLKATLEVRGKVRIGEKRQTKKGTTFPAATDYFVSDDAEFAQLVGEKQSSFRILLPHAAPGDNFTSGMEWWRGKQLSCYSKGEQRPVPGSSLSGTVAYRVIAVLDGDDVAMGAPMGRGNERQPIHCRFRACKHFGKNANNKECRVMGRLVFFLDGGRTDSVLEIDTKSWNSIEQLEGSLAGLARTAPLNAPGRVYTLTVEMRQSGRDKYPVLNISEVTDEVIVNTPTDAEIADAVIQLDAAYANVGNPDEASDEVKLKLRDAFFKALSLTHPTWRENEAVYGKFKEQGVMVSARVYLDRELAKWKAA